MAREQQNQILKVLDNSKIQWYHVKAVVISGMGFFTDAYDLFCISLVTKLLGRIYYHVDGSPKPGTLPPNAAAAVTGVALVGTLAGQLFFGWLGTRWEGKTCTEPRSCSCSCVPSPLDSHIRKSATAVIGTL